MPGPPVEMTYLGVGGWLIRRGDVAVLGAPLFSNPSLLATGTRAIGADSARIDGALEAMGVELEEVSVILSGHGHYDHLMDVPRVMVVHAPNAVLLANRTSAHQLAPWRLQDRIVEVNDSAASLDGPGRWIRVGEVRILPLRSHHAPHFAGNALYHGRRDRDLAIPPRTAPEWLDGVTHAFLVDFLDGDRVAFRLYYQDAVAAAPFGFLPEEIPGEGGADGRRVDVAILVPATYAEVDWHPEAILANVRPRHVLLGHWEDFFRSPFAEIRTVPFTDLPDFVARLERALDRTFSEPVGWHLPEPGARFRVR